MQLLVKLLIEILILSKILERFHNLVKSCTSNPSPNDIINASAIGAIFVTIHMIINNIKS